MIRPILAVFGSATLWLAAVLFPQSVPDPLAAFVLWQVASILSLGWLAWEAAEWGRKRLQEVSERSVQRKEGEE